MNSIIILVIGFRKLVLANEKYQYLLNYRAFSREFLLSGKTIHVEFTPQDNYCFTVYGLVNVCCALKL